MRAPALLALRWPDRDRRAPSARPPRGSARSGGPGALLGLLSLLLATAALAEDDETFPPPAVKLHAHAERARGPLVIDGRLDDDAWRGARPLEGFTQVEPHQGAPATLPTQVWVLVDDRALYVGARCGDPEGRRGLQQRNLARDFSPEESDHFGIALDTLGDGRNAVGFFVNPYGAQLDVQALDDASFQPEWDTVWRSAVTRDEGGWTVELAIPWRSLRMEPGRTAWGLQVVRHTRRLGETSAWSPFPRAFSPYRMAYAGVLELPQAPARSALNLQLRPYLIGRLSHEGQGPPQLRPTAGGEATWSPTAGSVLDLTVNTDFAETDVDKRVVNLSRFSVFFPERRQFFLESAGVFASGLEGFLQPFFSRTIGLAEEGPVPLNAGARFVLRSTTSSLGALVVNTAETEGLGGGLFGVGRSLHNFGEESHAGAMLVARRDFAKRGALEPVTNLVSALDGLGRAGPLTVSAAAMGSSTQVGDRAASFGAAGTLSATVRGSMGATGLELAALSPGFQARTGFVARSEVMAAHGWWYLDLRPAWLPKWIRSLNHYGEASVVGSTKDGSFQEAAVYLEPIWFRTKGGDKAWVFGQHQWQALSEPFAPVPGLAFPAGQYQFDTIGVVGVTDGSRAVVGGFAADAGRYFSAEQLHLRLSAGLQPIPHVSLTGAYDYNRFRGPGVRAGGAQTHLLTAEARLALSSRLQLYASYQRDTAGDVSVFNARVAWEYLPLSFVYLVASDSRGAYPSAAGPIPEQRVTLKATYTWRL